MNKYLLLFFLPFLSFVMVGCNDNEDDVVFAPKLELFGGTWEVVDQGNQKVFERDCILDITSAQIYEGYGGYRGYITTYLLLTVAGIPKHDRVFTFSILEVENNQPLLDVSFQGELDSDDVWAGNYPYKIIKLTDTDMWWQVNTNGDKSIIKFRHRNDIQIE
jgi:hypothetical protein